MTPTAAAQSEASDLPPWHPLRADRVANVRDAPSTTMSEGFYTRLFRVHELLDADSPEGALELMDRIRPDRIGKYEAAQLYHTYGFVYSQLGRRDEALEAFQKCLELDALPTHQQQGVVYSVAGFHAGDERYEESNAALLRWFRYESDPIAEAYIFMGANFAQREMMREALPYVVRANRLAKQPSQNWRNLQLAIHVSLRQLAEAIDLLKDNIGIWPGNSRNYVALSGLYTETGQDEGALAALSIPWKRGVLVAQAEILNLVRLNLFLENPARAGTILSEAMERGHVEESSENLQLLLNSWTMARETDRAVDTIDKLAQLAEDGEAYYRKALLLNETGEWEEVVESCRLAMEKGGLKKLGEVWLLQGVALAELGRFDRAIAAFENAKHSGNEGVRRSASTWISYVHERGPGS
ncbi:MAG: tetratricopeptide repeat protein [Gammaproteobacteria bacterium]|nr:tetratricopeptide repeat protein [Gammaproteobacteria bacterium]